MDPPIISLSKQHRQGFPAGFPNYRDTYTSAPEVSAIQVSQRMKPHDADDPNYLAFPSQLQFPSARSAYTKFVRPNPDGGKQEPRTVAQSNTFLWRIRHEKHPNSRIGSKIFPEQPFLPR
ncbi:MAG: hypothetical protein HC850_07780 [Rhodomicrobium sp.]|nr:hypothetical protein [Rhodomicrobium sp.]